MSLPKNPRRPHQTAQERRAWQSWYQTPLWKARRLQTLVRANWLCQIKATGCEHIASVADHVEPHNGDRAKFEHGALQAACRHCHNSYKKRLELSGTIAGCDRDGLPLNGRWGTGG